MSERNYGATGANEGSSGEAWCSIDASLNEPPKFRVGKKDDESSDTYTSVSGYLDAVDIRFSDGNQEKKVKPGWEFLLIMSVKDEVRGKASEETGGIPIAKYNIPVRCTHNTMMPALLNVLSGIDHLSWNGFLSLSLYRKTGKPARLSVKTRLNQAPKEFSPVRFPFDETTNRNIGVPEPTLVFDGEHNPVLDADGNQMKNWTGPRNFWLAIAKEIYQQVNGVPYTGNIGPSGPTGYKAGEPWGMNPPSGAQNPASSASTPASGAPAAPAKDSAENAKFFKGLKTKLDKIQSADTAKVLLEDLRRTVIKPDVDLSKWDTTENEVEAFLIDHYRILTGDTKAVWLPTGFISISSPSDADDLPF